MIMTACDVLLVFNSNQRSICLRYGDSDDMKFLRSRPLRPLLVIIW